MKTVRLIIGRDVLLEIEFNQVELASQTLNEFLEEIDGLSGADESIELLLDINNKFLEPATIVDSILAEGLLKKLTRMLNASVMNPGAMYEVT